MAKGSPYHSFGRLTPSVEGAERRRTVAAAVLNEPFQEHGLMGLHP